MKKTFLTILIITVVTFAFTSCKGEKKVEKEVKTEVNETITPAAEIVPATELTAEEMAFNAIVDKIDAANKCSACHKAEAKFVGPSYKEIAVKYKAEKGNLVKFLKEQADPIVDPPQFAVMKANLAITKKLSGDDLAAIATFIRSFE